MKSDEKKRERRGERPTQKTMHLMKRMYSLFSFLLLLVHESLFIVCSALNLFSSLLSPVSPCNMGIFLAPLLLACQSKTGGVQVLPSRDIQTHVHVSVSVQHTHVWQQKQESQKSWREVRDETFAVHSDSRLWGGRSMTRQEIWLRDIAITLSVISDLWIRDFFHSNYGTTIQCLVRIIDMMLMSLFCSWPLLL